MKQHELKQIRDALQFGDVTTIATEVGVSTVTVQNALRGIAMTPTAKLCIQHAQKLIQQRQERIAELKKIIAKQRKERESRLAGDQ
jgi:hypothetical protein